MNSGKKMHKTTNLIKLVFIVILSLILIYSILLFAPSADKNLIANPGFESGSTQPSNWEFMTTDGNTPVWDSVHHNGTRSIKISVPGTAGRNSGYPKSDLIKTESQQYYTLSAWGKTENAGADHVPAVRVVELDANKNWLNQTNLVFDRGTNDWTQKSMDFKTGPNTAYLYVYANIWNGYGTFWVDDVSLSKTSAPAPTPAPTAKPTTTAAPTPALMYNTYYVAKTGNDNNPGTEQSPWLTITKATNTLVAGDTVYIKEGTYNENVLIKNSGSPGKFITFAAYPGDSVTIDGTGLSVDMYDGLVQIPGSSYINLSGLRVINSKFTGIMVGRDYGTNALPSNIILEKNYISNTAASAIFVENGKNIILDGNEITKAQTMEGLSQQAGETISLVNVDGFEIRNNKLYQNNFESINAKEGSSNGKIYNNDISQHESAGIYVDAWSGNSHDIEIFSNKVHDGRVSGRGIALAIENGGTLKNVKVYNNIIYNNAATGIDLSWYSKGTIDNISITSNTVYNNGLIDSWGGGISADYSPATNVIIRNNIVSKNNHYSIRSKNTNAVIDHNLIDGYIGSQDEVKGSDYVEGSPEFINQANADFHLRSTSPAIEKGSINSVPNMDFDGNMRPRNASYDIGAFEHIS
ncbi:Right handed beta helix region [uncultured archaeon]|nr:Right handed beta helix region [uncultured archaeon]